ncbi:unnamed protein product [Amoebophrya sp. A25]|nr:unnamed protein product [Amoebophrya sp. A25]|eukprot:GSA25T00003369001.1
MSDQEMLKASQAANPKPDPSGAKEQDNVVEGVPAPKISPVSSPKNNVFAGGGLELQETSSALAGPPATKLRSESASPEILALETAPTHNSEVSRKLPEVTTPTGTPGGSSHKHNATPAVLVASHNVAAAPGPAVVRPALHQVQHLHNPLLYYPTTTTPSATSAVQKTQTYPTYYLPALRSQASSTAIPPTSSGTSSFTPSSSAAAYYPSTGIHHLSVTSDYQYQHPSTSTPATAGGGGYSYVVDQHQNEHQINYQEHHHDHLQSYYGGEGGQHGPPHHPETSWSLPARGVVRHTAHIPLRQVYSDGATQQRLLGLNGYNEVVVGSTTSRGAEVLELDDHHNVQWGVQESVGSSQSYVYNNGGRYPSAPAGPVAGAQHLPGPRLPPGLCGSRSASATENDHQDLVVGGGVSSSTQQLHPSTHTQQHATLFLPTGAAPASGELALKHQDASGAAVAHTHQLHSGPAVEATSSLLVASAADDLSPNSKKSDNTLMSLDGSDEVEQVASGYNYKLAGVLDEQGGPSSSSGDFHQANADVASPSGWKVQEGETSSISDFEDQDANSEQNNNNRPEETAQEREKRLAEDREDDELIELHQRPWCYNYPEGHYVPGLLQFDRDMRPLSQYDREQMEKVKKISTKAEGVTTSTSNTTTTNYDFTVLRQCIWRYLGYNELEIRAFGNTMRYADYKQDCIAYLRFLLSQEPQNCEWKHGYLLAMCLKQDFAKGDDLAVRGQSAAAAVTPSGGSGPFSTSSSTSTQQRQHLERVIDSQMFSLLTQLFIQDSRAARVEELEEIFLSLGARKKNSHVLAAMIRGYGCKGYWMSSLKLFLHSRERLLDPESKDYEYRYLVYQAALDWALHNRVSFMIYMVLRFCQIDGIPIRYPGGTCGKVAGGVDFVSWPVEELRFMYPEEPGLGAPKIKYYTCPSIPEERLSGALKPIPTHQAELLMSGSSAAGFDLDVDLGCPVAGETAGVGGTTGTVENGSSINMMDAQPWNLHASPVIGAEDTRAKMLSVLAEGNFSAVNEV